MTDTSSTWQQRYSRQIMLPGIDFEGQLKLNKSHALVVGCGGLGTPILTHLVAMGVGTITLVDRDVIELSNLHRQTLYTEADVGRTKVEAACERLGRLNSDCKLHGLQLTLTPETVTHLFEHGKPDVIIDALDSVQARYVLNEICMAEKIPFVSGGAVGAAGQVLVVMPDENGACYNCVFPGMADDMLPSCGIEGVNPAILSIVGGLQVAEAIRILCGHPPLTQGKVSHISLDDTRLIQQMTTNKVSECKVCSKDSDKSQLLQHNNPSEITVAELCSRPDGRTFSVVPAQRRVQILEHKCIQSVSDVDGSAIMVGCDGEEDARRVYVECTQSA